ncbi:MAG: ABC transporter substrate-binding protein, partial [Anaerolineales bacterium]|nr:ABC transporter substrate-binding protein [Anaerolineales bacterium]
MRRHRLVFFSALVLGCGLMWTGCQGPSPADFPLTLGLSPTPPTTSKPTEVPPPPETLVVCLAEEPASLYLYADTNVATDVVLQAIYDGPVDLLDFVYQPVILDKVPSLADGDAAIVPVPVLSGEIYWNPITQLAENLRPGKMYVPSGCENEACLRAFQGGEVQMDQLAADFQLRQGLEWSDGAPLTAADSVLSYQLDGASATPSLKFVFDRTQSYEALDERTVRWTGIPGFVDAEFSGNFWSPLPTHLLGGLSPEEVLDQEQANRAPVGWGPYVVSEWLPGEHILLERNPRYFRAEEGLPAFDRLLFRFVTGGPEAGVQQLLTTECDVLDEAVLLEGRGQPAPAPGLLETLAGYSEAGRLGLAASTGTLVTRLDFNLAPVGLQTHPPAYDRHVREAVDTCLDRESLNGELYAGLGGIPMGGLPPGHPLAGSGQTTPHDPAQANEALAKAGWLDSDGDPATPRLWSGGLGIPPGAPLTFRLTVAEGEAGRTLGQALQSQLAECGIGIVVEATSANDLAEPWPDGPVLGRTFETVIWSWPTLLTPLCESYASWEIPSQSQPLGINATGFTQPGYDAECRSLLLSRPEGERRVEAVQAMGAILAYERPGLSIAAPPRVVAHAPDLCGLGPNPSALTSLWNLEGIRR